MSKNETSHEQTTCKMQQSAQKPQQSQIPPQLQQQIILLNARINNVNFAYSDLLKEMNSTFNALLSAVVTLERENAELKAKSIEKP